MLGAFSSIGWAGRSLWRVAQTPERGPPSPPVAQNRPFLPAFALDGFARTWLSALLSIWATRPLWLSAFCSANRRNTGQSEWTFLAFKWPSAVSARMRIAESIQLQVQGGKLSAASWLVFGRISISLRFSSVIRLDFQQVVSFFRSRRMLKNHPGAVCPDWAHFTPAGGLLAIGLGVGLWAENAHRRLESQVARFWSASCLKSKGKHYRANR